MACLELWESGSKWRNMSKMGGAGEKGAGEGIRPAKKKVKPGGRRINKLAGISEVKRGSREAARLEKGK